MTYIIKIYSIYIYIEHTWAREILHEAEEMFVIKYAGNGAEGRVVDEWDSINYLLSPAPPDFIESEEIYRIGREGGRQDRESEWKKSESA